MTEEERYCTDVLYQIRAIERSLELTKRAILDEHLQVCVRDPSRGIHEGQYVDELLGSLFGGRPPSGTNYYPDPAQPKVVGAGKLEGDISPLVDDASPASRRRSRART
jgi:hypothetical protein